MGVWDQSEVHKLVLWTANQAFEGRVREVLQMNPPVFVDWVHRWLIARRLWESKYYLVPHQVGRVTVSATPQFQLLAYLLYDLSTKRFEKIYKDLYFESLIVQKHQR